VDFFGGIGVVEAGCGGGAKRRMISDSSSSFHHLVWRILAWCERGKEVYSFRLLLLLSMRKSWPYFVVAWKNIVFPFLPLQVVQVYRLLLLPSLSLIFVVNENHGSFRFLQSGCNNGNGGSTGYHHDKGGRDGRFRRHPCDQTW
jgi:hypothetical protein